MFQENKLNLHYRNFELSNAGELLNLVQKNPQLKGLNVTFPFKEQIIKYLSKIIGVAKEIEAVNVISIQNQMLIGYNTDVDAFRMSLQKILRNTNDTSSLILGNGGASKAIQQALRQMHIPFQIVTRIKQKDNLTYDELNKDIMGNCNLIINTTPLGTFPHTDVCPEIPYNHLTREHLLYDLVYNPSETLFMKNGVKEGARISNGYDMLKIQAELTWKIWNQSE